MSSKFVFIIPTTNDRCAWTHVFQLNIWLSVLPWCVTFLLEVLFFALGWLGTAGEV